MAQRVRLSNIKQAGESGVILIRHPTGTTLAEPHLAGVLLEAFVAMELRKRISWSHMPPGLAHVTIYR